MHVTPHALSKTVSAVLLILAVPALLCSCSSNTAGRVEGTEWVLIGWYEGTTCALPAVEGAQVTLEFAAEKEQVRGSTGCNQYSGAYDIDGDSLSINGIEATEEACPTEDLAQQERMYLDTLIEAESFSIRDGRLRIESGTRGLVFESREH